MRFAVVERFPILRQLRVICIVGAHAAAKPQATAKLLWLRTRVNILTSELPQGSQTR